MKANFLLTIIDGKPQARFSENADELIAAYKESTEECMLFIRPTASKRKRAMNSEAVTKKTKPAK
jgi:predicted GIY-YIG superfamily endonuclease